MNIVEVGTGTGVFSNWFLSSHKMEFKYYAIDPLAENLEKIKNDKRVVKINCAIGKRNEERLFYVNSNTDLSSFYPNQNLISKNLNSRIHVDDQFKKLEFTKVRTLTNILLESKLNTIHFLKLDTQGLDLEIILSLRKIVKK